MYFTEEYYFCQCGRSNDTAHERKRKREEEHNAKELANLRKTWLDAADENARMAAEMEEMRKLLAQHEERELEKLMSQEAEDAEKQRYTFKFIQNQYS